ncbi:hypothetical protein OSSY52_18890 [Tepiditoga spiralis]|uniref:Uncharacterized protein n=1 Tax=Tepiditoga spiralis TaxID=2108365 RepID=A0A7G1G5A3_9BACT|nr:hypothetical protein [Tepiditoga spiralis]BBE31748.1 hypothetical protein OSSY52_18890 [Tepiditoga spiralis]
MSIIIASIIALLLGVFYTGIIKTILIIVAIIFVLNIFLKLKRFF